IPKDLALRKPDATALWVARPMLVLTKLFRPFVVLMLVTKKDLLRCFGMQPSTAGETPHSIEELSLLVEDSQGYGILNQTQADLVQWTLHPSGKKVKDCLVPREKMVALKLKTSPEQLLEVLGEEAYARMPVFDDDLDNIVGIVNTQTLLQQIILNGLLM